MIKLIAVDIDGVLTDGKVYCSENGAEQKTLSLKDMDAITEIKARKIKFGIITGEKNYFTRYMYDRLNPDFFVEECKEKKNALIKMEVELGILSSEICYVGDGKYDQEAIIYSGLGVCPRDAIEAVKKVADIVLNNDGGKGCIAELLKIIDDCAATAPKHEDLISTSILEHIEIVKLIENNWELKKTIKMAIEAIKATFREKGQVLICGNGGSAADAQHIATEFVSRFYKERAALNAEALTVNTSSITAIGNDDSFEYIFERQVEAKGKAGDILIGLSTGGNSQNVVQAIRKANEIGMVTIAFTGCNLKGKLAQEADIVISVPSAITPRIQEMHIMIGHIICERVEEEVFLADSHLTSSEGLDTSREEKYQDYVIKNGKFVGKFEEMYQKFENPWHQLDKTVGLYGYAMTQTTINIRKLKYVLEVGCGLGVFTDYLTNQCTNTKIKGIDVSETAIQKAKRQYPNIEFAVGNVNKIDESWREFDGILFAEIMWYILEDLDAVILLLKKYCSGILLMIKQMFYQEKIQKYGTQFFTTQEEMIAYLPFELVGKGSTDICEIGVIETHTIFRI